MTAFLECCAKGEHRPGRNPERLLAAILYCDSVIDPVKVLGCRWQPRRPSTRERKERFAAARERLVAARGRSL